MAAHIAVPCIDATGTPASLSEPIISGILRDQMNFRGVVFTDDLEMGALNEIDTTSIAVQALQAGCDMLLYCHSADKARQALDAIHQAIAEGTLSAERVQNSIDRVQWAKRKFGVLVPGR